MRTLLRACAGLVIAGLIATVAAAAPILFDATKHEMAGNADWVIDADAWSLNMPAFPCTGSTNESNPSRFPSPSAAGVTAATPETYWTGAISAWALELVKAGHSVESLPDGGRITFGDATNPQDLSGYRLLIVVEPQAPFTAAEKSALLAFVGSGGGLFMIGDHETSDRDCDGWDSPHVWNDLTGAVSGASGGVFGIWFRVDGSETHPSEDWFDEAVNNNVETAPGDPILHGPFGSGAGGLGLFGSTSMDLDVSSNATVQGRIWRNGQAHGAARATFATAQYGAGRVAALVDSSPADDGTGDPSDSLHPGWDKATGGVANREIHLNACQWLINPAPDTTPPSIVAGPSATAADCSARIAWTTDEVSTSVVDYGPTDGYGQSNTASGLTLSHAVDLAPLTPATVVHYRVSSVDGAGNGPAQSADATFSTSAPAPPQLTTGPSASGVTSAAATIAWDTDEPATSQVEYGTTTAYGSTASSAGASGSHAVTLTGLTPDTLYHYRALSTDACGNGPSASGDGTFTTGPASTDVSGWSVKQFTSTLTFVIPAGTFIPSGGYVVIGRDSPRASFESTFPSMPPATIYLDSNASGACANGCLPQVNGGETFELWNAANVKVDGPTIAMSSTHMSYQRLHPGDPAGSPASWSILPESSAGPGQGAGSPGGAGVRINEMSDSSDFTKEFVELYNDTGSSPPDTVPPAAITNLDAVPLSSSSVRLSWTASGDDGTSGVAAAYDIRMSARPIMTLADFGSAAPIAGPPAPIAAGSPQIFTVGGLPADTGVFFALRVRDDALNVSDLSNCEGAETAPPGGGPPPATHLVISQVQTSGDGSPPADDEFIELYNPTPAAVPLSGLSVQYKSATGSTHAAFALPAHSIPAQGWYLVARSVYNGSTGVDAVNTIFQMAASGGNVFLVNGTAALPSASCSSSANIVDKVGYGTGNCPESAAIGAPSANGSATRKPGGAGGSGQDTESNAADFQLTALSTPHNRLSPPATPPSSLGNVGNTLYLRAQASGTDIDWAGASGATGYNVYRGTTANFMSGLPAPWTTATSSRTIDAAIPAPILFYLILATDGTSESTN